MHVSGAGRGILEIDLSTVLGNDEEKNALSMVKSLDLSRNELTVITNLQPLTSLTVLDVSYNRVAKLSGLPLGLTRLNVSHNCLTNVEGIAALPFLAELDISYNKVVSLSGLHRLSPLTVLNASHNRLANLVGVEVLSKLQVLLLDNNYFCNVNDVQQLGHLLNLKTLSFRGCPITELNDYRSLMKQLAGRVSSLDGTVFDNKVVGAMNTSFQSRPSPMHYDAHDTSVASQQRYNVDASQDANQSSMQVDGINASSMAVENVRARSEMRKQELTERIRKAEKENHRMQVLLEQEQKENALLRHKNSKIEHQLSENRRVLADELSQVSELRDHNRRLEEELVAAKTKVDRVTRDYKYLQQKLHSEQRKRAEEFEVSRVNHDAAVSDLKAQIHANLESSHRIQVHGNRAQASVDQLTDRIADLETKNHVLVMALSKYENADGPLRSPPRSNMGQRRDQSPARLPARPIFSAQGVSADHPPSQSETSPAAVDFAEQLKNWLLAEVGSNDIHSPGHADSPPRKSSGKHPVPVTDLWKQNEKRL